MYMKRGENGREYFLLKQNQSADLKSFDISYINLIFAFVWAPLSGVLDWH